MGVRNRVDVLYSVKLDFGQVGVGCPKGNDCLTAILRAVEMMR